MNLKAIRTASGLSQRQLAEASGVNLRMIQHYEQGTKDINKAEALTVYKLSQALNCQMEELLSLPDAEEEPEEHEFSPEFEERLKKAIQSICENDNV